MEPSFAHKHEKHDHANNNSIHTTHSSKSYTPIDATPPPPTSTTEDREQETVNNSQSTTTERMRGHKEMTHGNILKKDNTAKRKKQYKRN